MEPTSSITAISSIAQGLIVILAIVIIKQYASTGTVNISSSNSTPLELKGYRRLGLSPDQSNIRDEYDPKYECSNTNPNLQKKKSTSYSYSSNESDKDEMAMGNNSIDNSNLNKPTCHIKALFTYPIKSCAGIELDVAHVVPEGIKYDRTFCFAEAVPNDNGASVSAGEKSELNNANSGGNSQFHWQARTMRNGRFSRLALVRPEIWIPDEEEEGEGNGYNKGQLSDSISSVGKNQPGIMTISYPRVPNSIITKLGMILGLISNECTFQVPLFPSEDSPSPIPVKIWKDTPLAYDYGQYIPQSFLDFIYKDREQEGRATTTTTAAGTRRRISTTKPSKPKPHLTLFRITPNPNHKRKLFRNAPRKQTLGFQPITDFADAYPLHLLNLASARDVAARCRRYIPHLSVRRFRANIIIHGLEAFAEDNWKFIRIQRHNTARMNVDNVDHVDVHAVSRTIRCRLPNVDPDTGVRHESEPDRTLRSYRCIDAGEPRFACLGMQLVPAQPGMF